MPLGNETNAKNNKIAIKIKSTMTSLNRRFEGNLKVFKPRITPPMIAKTNHVHLGVPGLLAGR